MKKIVGLGITAAVVITLVATGTLALFSDTETSEDNQMTAGVIDLEVDSAGDTVFSAQDDPLPKIFEYMPSSDIKPGDSGEVTLSLHLKSDIGGDTDVDSNNADLWMQVINLVDDGGAFPEPEEEAEDGTPVDEISKEIRVLLWTEEDGDNLYEPGDTEVIIFGTSPISTSSKTLWNLWDETKDTDEELSIKTNAVASTTYYVGWAWELNDVGNEYQGDYCTFDIVFGADQIVP